MSLLQNKPVVIGVGAVAAALAAFLAFGVFGIQTLFTNTTVDEGGPVFASGETATVSDDGDGATADAADDGAAAADADAATEEPTAEAEEAEAANEIISLAEGSFTSLSRYNVTGTATVLNDGTEQRFLRLEGFESTNGPDLNVYLRAEDGEFIDLGDLKGNIGDQNYEIPVDVDLERFNTVEIWCVRFGVGFGEAELA
ncbi:MAG: DM13 domain-containing protein [Actinomycetota bacterium]